MQITLNQKEIQQALLEFVTKQGINLEGANTEVSFLAGRGEHGYKATIDITPIEIHKKAIRKQKSKAKVPHKIVDEPIKEDNSKAPDTQKLATLENSDEQPITEDKPVPDGASLFAKKA